MMATTAKRDATVKQVKLLIWDHRIKVSGYRDYLANAGIAEPQVPSTDNVLRQSIYVLHDVLLER